MTRRSAAMKAYGYHRRICANKPQISQFSKVQHLDGQSGLLFSAALGLPESLGESVLARTSCPWTTRSFGIRPRRTRRSSGVGSGSGPTGPVRPRRSCCRRDSIAELFALRAVRHVTPCTAPCRRTCPDYPSGRPLHPRDQSQARRRPCR